MSALAGFFSAAFPFASLRIGASFTKGMKARPPMYGLRGSGTTMPSGVWKFSMMQQIVRSVAVRVLFNM